MLTCFTKDQEGALVVPVGEYGESNCATCGATSHLEQKLQEEIPFFFTTTASKLQGHMSENRRAIFGCANQQGISWLLLSSLEYFASFYTIPPLDPCSLRFLLSALLSIES